MWGWESDYAQLREVGIEAVQAHLPFYLEETFWRSLELFAVHNLPPLVRVTEPPAPVYDEQGRRQARDGQPIPYSYVYWHNSRPNDRPAMTIAEDLVLRARLAAMFPELPQENGKARVYRLLQLLTRTHPPMLAYIVLGVAGALLVRFRDWLPLSFFAAVCLAVPLIGWLGAAPVPEHAIPIYPVLLLFGVLGGLHLAYRTLGKRYSAD
ncbi:MAG: hypothetical protein HC876_17655 [Chloroflexaceae bacterium]|nr:hypothetical protein [Chloroflexaceae bacterium]